MTEITNEFQYNLAKEELEDGVRLVLWAQDAKVSIIVIQKSIMSNCKFITAWGLGLTYKMCV